ncbi:MAG TPA: hypothetical protein VNX02_06325 [Steroidobacteraceae bacterium]|nr:hypothetical protein [Steroidobacteraceae bacterium]
MKLHLVVSSLLAAIAVPDLLSAASAVNDSATTHDLVKALNHGDCDTAVRVANTQTGASDAQALFLVGRMVAEGVCVQPDVAAATPYFSHAATQGLAPAELEYGVQVGLGEGAVQSYEQAGELCQRGGLGSPAGAASRYSLGYICTLRGLVSRRLRQSLPRGAFVPGTGVARVSFNPASGLTQIRSTPRVTSQEDATTGTFIHHPLFDAQATIDKAWREAMGAVPKPDAARLENQSVEVTLDLDMTIEGGLANHHTEPRVLGGALLPGEVHPILNAPH